MVLGVAVLVCLARVLFLDAARIRQHETGEIDCACRAEDVTRKALGHQARQVADVIEMGVGEHDCRDRSRIHRKRVPVAFSQFFQPLKKPAVEEHRGSAVIQQVFGPGDRTCGSQEREFGHRGTISGFVHAVYPQSMHRRARCFVSWLWIVFAATLVHGQTPKPLSIDVIYDPSTRVSFSGRVGPDPEWIDEASYVRATRGANGTEWQRVDAATGQATPLFDAAKMQAALARLPGVSAEAAARSRAAAALNDQRTGVLLTIADDLAYYDIHADVARLLTQTPGAEENAAFSPDGRFVAFVRDHNLYVVEVAEPRERALTKDGSPQILNGTLDWLYQEEVYGRGRFQGYWWSPDSS